MHVAAAHAEPVTLEVEATLSPPGPAPVSMGSPIAATVNFGTSFSSIDSICFNFHFQSDLLDLGEELFFGPFEGQNTSQFGFFNNSTSPVSDRVVCILGGVHAEVSFFLDGQSSFGIRMDAGSVIISSLRVSISGMLLFPQTGVLDDFNRSNGRLGPNWDGKQGPNQYRIVNQNLNVEKGGPIRWERNTFGTAQEAFVTFAHVDRHGRQQSLLLKVQGDKWHKGGIVVFYNGRRQQVRIEIFVPHLGWTTLAIFDAVLHDGDKLGARALANGKVQAYVNGALLGEADAGSFFADKGGRIGLWFIDADDALLDDFGGGTLP
jgi:hypothetical protein